MPSHQSRKRTKVESALIEAGAVFAALIAALRIIEKLVDQKFGKKNGGPVQIDINQTEVAGTLREVGETQKDIAATLERANDKLNTIDTRTKETGSTVFEVRELIKIEQAKNEARLETLISQRGTE